MTGDRLSAIIDCGGAGRGDSAQDLAPAWSVLNAAGRSVFRESVGANDAAWIRGRTFELEHAVGGVLYYVPKQHPLGDAMAERSNESSLLRNFEASTAAAWGPQIPSAGGPVLDGTGEKCR